MSVFNLFEINGQLDTKKTILENLNNIASSSQSFLTWDPAQGKWRVILNRPANGLSETVMYFDDDNIVGAVNVTGSGITDKYNQLRVDFSSNDLEGEKDETYFEIASGDRYSNEVNNEMSVSYDLIDNQWQAERMGKIELKQSRVDKIISFAADYRAIIVKPGDIIAVTNSVYAYTQKRWRVQSVEEIDTEDGGIIIGIVALEYDVDVYDETGITVIQRDRDTGIVPAESNMCIIESDQEALSNQIAGSLNTDAGVDALTQDITAGSSTFSIPLFQTESVGWSASQVSTVYGPGTPYQAQLEAIIQTYRPIKTCYFNFEAPQGDLTYTLDGTQKTLVALGLPTVLFIQSRALDVATQTGIGSYSTISTRYMEWSSYFTQISLATAQPTEFRVIIRPLNTYDLSATTPLVQFDSSTNYIPNANGDYATLSVAAFLN